MKDDKQERTSLVSFKIVLLLFFGGIGALVPFLPLHMRAAGLTAREARMVSAVAPLTALPGPILAAYILDKRRSKQVPGGGGTSEDGKRLRFLLAFTLLASALCYSLLLLLPSVTWFPARRPSVSFSCNLTGAAVLQERCMEPACYHWPDHQVGPLILSNCQYDCQDESRAAVGRAKHHRGSVAEKTDGEKNETLSVEAPRNDPPHICVSEPDKSSRTCHVFTIKSSDVLVNASLLQATNPEAEQDQWCNYPVAESFSCSLPANLGSNCRVLCDIEHPYTAEGSILAQSQCQVVDGDPTMTFWSYLLVRHIADTFLTASLVIVDTALLVATREDSSGRKPDLGRQLGVGLLATALFAPLAGYFSPYPAAGPGPVGWPAYGVPILMFAGCMVLASFVLFCSKAMPVGAPDWWWQLRKPTHKSPAHTGCESAALFIILALLGAFCSAIDSYLPWHIRGLRHLSDRELSGWGVTPELLLGLNVLVGVLPAVPLLWRGEVLVHYCGVSNLFITAFTFYIIRYAGLSFMWSPWWILALEATEMFTLSVMWLTAVLSSAHIFPRYLSATGQALAVTAHFCIGRSLGALVGGLVSRDASPPDDDHDTAPPDDPGRPLYSMGSAGAAVVAVLYFCIYYCCVRPKCSSSKERKANQRSVHSGQNMNGSYTPLRVHHNGRDHLARPEF